jgi:hypothetical protein
MRTLLLAAAAIATPSFAEDTTWLLPQPGIYCPVGRNVLPLQIDEAGGMGIDGLDCERVRLEGGKVRSQLCYSNGGHIFVYETDLIVLPDGNMVHDGITFRRRRAGPPCPVG